MNRKQQFFHHVNDMMRKGFRAYFISDVGKFEQTAHILANKRELYIETYPPHKVVFVKNAFPS